MDIFGRRRAAQLRNDLEHADELNLELSKRLRASEEQLRAAQNQVEYLVRTIRDMDQEIWNMAQKTSWEQQRPHFIKLQDGMTARKVAESNRIGDLLRPQLLDTYTESDHHVTKRLK